jgi:hypothetical protein
LARTSIGFAACPSYPPCKESSIASADLVNVLEVLRTHDDRFAAAHRVIVARAARHAQILERLIAPDGTYPVVGRSIAYRCGAFQALAQMALRRELPDSLRPAQVRCTLTALIRRTLEAPGTWDPDGWLRIGLADHQPALGESYISTGSLYLCSFVLLPLGLAPTDPFWSSPAEKWTAQRVWSEEDSPADHALADLEKADLPASLKSEPKPPAAAQESR